MNKDVEKHGKEKKKFRKKMRYKYIEVLLSEKNENYTINPLFGY